MKPSEIKEADVLLTAHEALLEMLAYANMEDVECGQIQLINEMCDSGHNTLACAQLPRGLTIILVNSAVKRIELKLKELGVNMPFTDVTGKG